MYNSWHTFWFTLSKIKVMNLMMVFLFFIGIGTETPAQQYRTIDNKAFKRGELLKYRIHYGIIEAAEATLEVKNETKSIGNRNCLHVVGLGNSKPAWDVFFKVRDRYETYIDEEAIVPWVFIRRVDEGGYIINQNQVYNHNKKTVNSDGKNFNIPQYCQDMLSAFYFARTANYDTLKKGDVITVNAFVDNEIFPLKIKFMGKEAIKSDIGKINCLKFRPIIQKGRIFKDEEDLEIWISDDPNHVPIRAKADILFGSLKIDLTSYSNLANELNLVKKK